MHEKTGIYFITNSVNGKRYIGSGINIYDRWNNHIKRLKNGKHNKIFQNAWNKYGADAFEFTIFESNILPENLLSWEQAAFEYFQPEYNIAKIAGSNFGLSPSLETRIKLSKAIKGEKNYWYNKKHSEKSKLKMSQSHKGSIFPPRTEEHKLKISIRNRGENHGLSKLTESKVRGIKYLLKKTNLTQIKISKLYGISQSAIADISKGKNWKHVI